MSIIQKIAKYTYWFYRPFESGLINKYGSIDTKFKPVFIVGAPRTGSTILFQLLTNNFNVLYSDNLVELFHRNFYLGFWLSNLVFNSKPHDCYSSDLGQTKSCGLHAPSESGAFWYRWLPKDKHYCTRNDISKQELLEIKNNINSVLNRYKKPFIFKNLNAGQRLDLIHALEPKSKIIYIKRNPVFTVQSIYNAKLKLGIEPNSWWSIKPKNYLELEKLPAMQQIVKQVFYLERQILLDSKLFDESDFITINYSDIDSKNYDILVEMKKFIGQNIKERRDVKLPDLKISEGKKVSDEIFNEIKSEVAKYDWENYEIK